MKQDRLEANDESVESTRESGIFTDLAVRNVDAPRESSSRRSIPPPPPRTRSSIAPVPSTRALDAEPGLEDEALVAPELDVQAGVEAELENQEAIEPEFDDEEPVEGGLAGEKTAVAEIDELVAAEFARGDDSPRPIRPSGTSPSPAPSSIAPGRVNPAAATARSFPPPPPRGAGSTLPGMSIPAPQPGLRPGSSIRPGTLPVSAAVASAAAAAVAADSLPTRAPSQREMSGTFQRARPARTSDTPALHQPASLHGVQSNLDHFDAPYGTAPVPPPASNLVAYALLSAGALIAACFAWYMLDTRMVPGVVQLETSPADATVLFDGEPVGSVSPFLRTGVIPGTQHRLEVKKPGFRTWAQRVEVQSGQTLAFTVSLPPEAGADSPLVQQMAVQAPAAVEVVAAVQPVEAVEFVEVANPVDAVQPVEAAATKGVAPRALAAKASAPNAASARPSARAIQTTRETKNAATEGATGTLRVSSRPWSNVTVDGKVVGNTPQMNLVLPVGSHRVELRNPEFELGKVITVSIEAGKTETLIVNLP